MLLPYGPITEIERWIAIHPVALSPKSTHYYDGALRITSVPRTMCQNSKRFQGDRKPSL
jgi:hypothetical protein